MAEARSLLTVDAGPIPWPFGPARDRDEAIRSFATTYSVAVALFGGTTQLIVTWLVHVTGSAWAPAWHVIGFGAVGQIAVMLFPETAPARLRYAREWMTQGSP